jgi:hypothetical protein
MLNAIPIVTTKKKYKYTQKEMRILNILLQNTMKKTVIQEIREKI